MLHGKISSEEDATISILHVVDPAGQRGHRTRCGVPTGVRSSTPATQWLERQLRFRSYWANAPSRSPGRCLVFLATPPFPPRPHASLTAKQLGVFGGSPPGSSCDTTSGSARYSSNVSAARNMIQPGPKNSVWRIKYRVPGERREVAFEQRRGWTLSVRAVVPHADHQ